MPNQNSSSPEAQEYFNKAQGLKTQGRVDEALTEFRRAILADPNFQAAHFEIGRLCKTKSATQPLFLRYAFDAFRQAVRRDLTHQEAHDQYIIVSQKMGRLEDLLKEYDGWVKQNPDNEFLKQCKKNVVTISMAMMPEKVNVGGSQMGGLRKPILFFSLGSLLFGAVFIFGPSVLRNLLKLEPGLIKQFLYLGIGMDVAGLGGLVLFTRMK